MVSKELLREIVDGWRSEAKTRRRIEDGVSHHIARVLDILAEEVEVKCQLRVVDQPAHEDVRTNKSNKCASCLSKNNCGPHAQIKEAVIYTQPVGEDKSYLAYRMLTDMSRFCKNYMEDEDVGRIESAHDIQGADRRGAFSQCAIVDQADQVGGGNNEEPKVLAEKEDPLLKAASEVGNLASEHAEVFKHSCQCSMCRAERANFNIPRRNPS